MSHDIVGWVGSVAAKYVFPLFARLVNLFARRPAYREKFTHLRTGWFEWTSYRRDDDRQP